MVNLVALTFHHPFTNRIQAPPMKPINQLASLDGVLAAGEFSYHGEGFSYAGLLEPEQARMAAIMCRANTEAVTMQADLIDDYSEQSVAPTPRGWMVTSEHFSVCVVGTLFCFIDNASGSLNEVMRELEKLAPRRGANH